MKKPEWNNGGLKMSIFDKIRNNSQTQQAPAQSTFDKSQKSATISFAALPESLAQLQALPEASLDTPFKTAALTLCALCAYAAEPTIGIEMLNYLRGPAGPMSNYDLSFLKDRFMDAGVYIPFSYFDGAKPENDYTPSEPFTVTISAGPYAYQNDGYATLDIRSGGADSPRQITLRQKGNQWFLWEQRVMVGVRKPKSLDPWA